MTTAITTISQKGSVKAQRLAYESAHRRDVELRESIDDIVLPKIVAVVAASKNGVIGCNGELPWRLADDLALFRSLTMAHPIIIGRKTYESIGRPLPGRVSIVLSRSPDWSPGAEGVLVAKDLDEAVRLAASAPDMDCSEAYIVGGGEVYRQALPRANRIHLTRVHTTLEGDAYFPELDANEWRITKSEKRAADDRNEHDCTFLTYDRVLS